MVSFAAKQDEYRMRQWLPMDLYPHGGHRDDAGKWHELPGPMVELRFECGHVTEASWHGKTRVDGGETWAFWTRDGDWIAFYDPVGWRHIDPRITQ